CADHHVGMKKNHFGGKWPQNGRASSKLEPPYAKCKCGDLTTTSLLPNLFVIFISYAVSLSSILLAKYAAQEVYGVSGVASASTIGILAGLTLPSPYRETAYGAGFVSASTNEAFTIQWEPFICFVYVCVVFSLRHVLLGIGGKLGMMAYVAGHISALFIVLVGAGSWSSTSLDPEDAFESWVDFWFRSHADGNVLISTIITIGFVIACGTASSLTLWLHLHFDNHLSPVVASSLVSLAAGLFLPPSTNPLMFFIWTGSFVGMSGPAASPGAYSIITVKDSPVLSDVTSIFLTGLWAGILLISFWWWTGQIGGRYGFIAFVACITVHLLTKILRKKRPEAEESGDDTDDTGKENADSEVEVLSRPAVTTTEFETDDRVELEYPAGLLAASVLPPMRPWLLIIGYSTPTLKHLGMSDAMARIAMPAFMKDAAHQCYRESPTEHANANAALGVSAGFSTALGYLFGGIDFTSSAGVLSSEVSAVFAITAVYVGVFGSLAICCVPEDKTTTTSSVVAENCGKRLCREATDG
ncbi:hypothetical protein FOZ63_029325, partial [Perkinsus olseni]